MARTREVFSRLGCAREARGAIGVGVAWLRLATTGDVRTGIALVRDIGAIRVGRAFGFAHLSTADRRAHERRSSIRFAVCHAATVDWTLLKAGSQTSLALA
jgi:hypothetical protein